MGYGRLVVQALERYASELGYKEVELHAELTAVPFYKKMAYQPVGTVYQEDGIPCQTMKKRII
jgi:predicted GNAT family N-acyltransferase